MPNTKRVGVNQYTLDGEYLQTFKSMNKAAKEVFGCQSNISLCVQGKIKQAYGFIWKRADESNEGE